MQRATSGILAGFPAAERKYTAAAHFQAVARRIVLGRQDRGKEAYKDKRTEIPFQATGFLYYKDPPTAEVNYGMGGAPSIINMTVGIGVLACNLAVCS
jgi:hypothetical protein